MYTNAPMNVFHTYLLIDGRANYQSHITCISHFIDFYD